MIASAAFYPGSLLFCTHCERRAMSSFSKSGELSGVAVILLAVAGVWTTGWARSSSPASPPGTPDIRNDAVTHRAAAGRQAAIAKQGIPAASAGPIVIGHQNNPAGDTMNTITSRDGTRIAFWRSGSGQPLVLVHGTTADHTRWARLLPELERDFTVYAIDRRGRGGSGDSAEYSLDREAEDVASVIDAIGEPVFLLGHSYGALCSLDAALLTGKVQRLILYEPPLPLGAPIYPPGVPERIQALVDAGEREAALEVMMREVVRMPEHEFAVYRALPAWQVRVALAPTIPRELTIEKSYRFRPERFAAMQTPTLLLLGGDSPAFFRKAIEALDAALPNSRIAVMPGQQHIAMDVVPALFLGEVRRFLSGPTTTAAGGASPVPAR
jgi:pimeloyl-ACP methyl ester carboxylesterase